MNLNARKKDLPVSLRISKPAQKRQRKAKAETEIAPSWTGLGLLLPDASLPLLNPAKHKVRKPTAVRIPAPPAPTVSEAFTATLAIVPAPVTEPAPTVTTIADAEVGLEFAATDEPAEAIAQSAAEVVAQPIAELVAEPVVTDRAAELAAKTVAEPTSAMAAVLRRVWQALTDLLTRHGSTKRLRVCESVALGEKRFVAIVRVDSQSLLLGGSSASVSLLAKLNDPENFSEIFKKKSDEALLIQ